MKKILLGLGTLAAIASPVVLAVSCGDKGQQDTKPTNPKDTGTLPNAGGNTGDQGVDTHLTSFQNENGIKITTTEDKVVTSIEVTGTFYRDISELMTDVNSLIDENELLTQEDKNIIEFVTVAGNDALKTLVDQEIANLNKVEAIEISFTQTQLDNVVTIDPATGQVSLHELSGVGFMVYLTDSLNSVVNDGDILSKKDIITATVVANDGYVLAHGSAHSATDSFIPHETVQQSSDTSVTVSQDQLDGIVSIDPTTHVVTINNLDIEGINFVITDNNNNPVTNGQVLTETTTITVTATAETGYVLAGGSAHSSSDTITITPRPAFNEYTLNASEQITEAYIQEALDRIHSSSSSNFALTVQGRHSRGMPPVGNGSDNNATVIINAADRLTLDKNVLATKIKAANGLDVVSKLEVDFAFGRTNILTNAELGSVYHWFTNDTWAWPNENFNGAHAQKGKPIILPGEANLLSEFMNRTGGGIVSVNDSTNARLYISFPKSFGTISSAQITQITNAVSVNSIGSGLRTKNIGYGESGNFDFTIENVPMGWYKGQPIGAAEHILITLETGLTGDFVDGWWAHGVMADGPTQSMAHVLPLDDLISGAH